MTSRGKISRLLRGVVAILFTALLCLAPATLWGATCPLCYSKAMSTSAGLLQAFRNGIVVLMIPPFLMSVGITAMAYRRRNQFRSAATDDAPDSIRPGLLRSFYERHKLN